MKEERGGKRKEGKGKGIGREGRKEGGEEGGGNKRRREEGNMKFIRTKSLNILF